jgi:hypothetical protein
MGWRNFEKSFRAKAQRRQRRNGKSNAHLWLEILPCAFASFAPLRETVLFL